jgi:hypothetical protein
LTRFPYPIQEVKDAAFVTANVAADLMPVLRRIAKTIAREERHVAVPLRPKRPASIEGRLRLTVQQNRFGPSHALLGKSLKVRLSGGRSGATRKGARLRDPVAFLTSPWPRLHCTFRSLCSSSFAHPPDPGRMLHEATVAREDHPFHAQAREPQDRKEPPRPSGWPSSERGTAGSEHQVGAATRLPGAQQRKTGLSAWFPARHDPMKAAAMRGDPCTKWEIMDIPAESTLQPFRMPVPFRRPMPCASRGTQPDVQHI